MVELGVADLGSCALLAMYEPGSKLLRVASFGRSRAVLGPRKWRGAWEAMPLSIDHTCDNPDEVARLQMEHPNEPGMIEDGQLLNSTVTREFGGLHEQAVDLVVRWLAKNNLGEPTVGKVMAGTMDEFILNKPPSDGAGPGREYANMKKVNEENLVVVDDNAAAHLVRNALGGKDEDMLLGLVFPYLMPSVRMRSVRARFRSLPSTLFLLPVTFHCSLRLACLPLFLGHMITETGCEITGMTSLCR
ncbi:MAG: hypothetical protein Q9210_001476 [Variospora velana]